MKESGMTAVCAEGLSVGELPVPFTSPAPRNFHATQRAIDAAKAAYVSGRMTRDEALELLARGHFDPPP